VGRSLREGAPQNSITLTPRESMVILPFPVSNPLSSESYPNVRKGVLSPGPVRAVLKKGWPGAGDPRGGGARRKMCRTGGRR
jgi:hypothetical protein